MSVLHICCNFGDSKAFCQLFRMLGEGGLAQQVYVPEKRAADMGKHALDAEGIPTHYSLIVKPWDRALYYTKAMRAVPDLCARVPLAQVTLVHAHTLFTDGGIAYRLHRTRGLPYVVSVRYTDVEYFYRYMPHLRGHALAVLQAARQIVFISPAHRDAVLSRYVPAAARTALAAKCSVVPNGIDPAWLDGTARTWTPGEPLRVAFAGKLIRVKQPARAMEAVQALQALMPGERVTLHVAGAGPLAESLRTHPAVRAGQAVLHGRLEGMDALKAFYDAAHLFLLPSTAETFGLVYLEAMSRGLPVLYTRGQGFDGQFPEGEVGFAVDPQSPQDMARAALRALEGYAARSQRCVAVAATLPWQATAERMRAVYARALTA